MNREVWTFVYGYPGLYEVSTLGRIRSMDRVVPCGLGRTRTIPGRIRALTIRKDNRLTVGLTRADGKITTHYIHKLVLLSFRGPPPPGTEGCHNDGNYHNCALDNLRWDTRSSNTLDQVRHGTHNKARLQVCPYQHKLIKPNLVRCILLRGCRNCLACNRARANAQTARQRGIPFNFKATADKHYQSIMKTVSA